MAGGWQTDGDIQMCVACANSSSNKRFPLSNYRMLLEKLTVPQPANNSLHFMQYERSLPHSQQLHHLSLSCATAIQSTSYPIS